MSYHLSQNQLVIGGSIPPSTAHPPRLLLRNSQNVCPVTQTPDLPGSDTTCRILHPIELPLIPKPIGTTTNCIFPDKTFRRRINTSQKMCFANAPQRWQNNYMTLPSTRWNISSVERLGPSRSWSECFPDMN